MSEIIIIGLGYVGLTMASCLADRGFTTTGVDVDNEKAAKINSGKSPIHEPHLEELISKAIKAGTFKVTLDLGQASEDASIIFITVGTPSQSNGSIDLDQIRSASESIGRAIKCTEEYRLIVVRSTVVPGTCSQMIKPLLEKVSGKTCGTDFGLCSNPEFLSEGSAVKDMLKPDRLIIGEHDEKSGTMLEDFYQQFYMHDMPNVIRTSLTNAELIKYANNAFLATKVSFINSLANLCEHIPDCNVEVIARGIGLDPRIGPLFLRAGLGWGGSCFPKDVRAILAFAKSQNAGLPIVDAALRINELQPLWAVQKAKEALRELKNKRIAILGLAFKPDTDDVREAVSIRIIDELLQQGAIVSAYDPAAIVSTRKIFGERITFSESAEECIRGVDCCIIATEWDEFKRIPPEHFVAKMRRPMVIDGRRIYDAREFLKNVEYYSVGLGKTN